MITTADVRTWVVEAYTARQRPRNISLDLDAPELLEIVRWIGRLRSVHQRYVEEIAPGVSRSEYENTYVVDTHQGRPLEPWLTYAISMHDPICAVLRKAAGLSKPPYTGATSPLIKVMMPALTAIDGRTDRTRNAVAVQLSNWRHTMSEGGSETYSDRWAKIVDGSRRVSQRRIKYPQST